jgi:hypothetical protein
MKATAAYPSHELKPVLKRHKAHLEALSQGDQAIVVQIQHPIVQRSGQKLLRHEKLRSEGVGFALERIGPLGGDEMPDTARAASGM